MKEPIQRWKGPLPLWYHSDAWLLSRSQEEHKGLRLLGVFQPTGASVLLVHTSEHETHKKPRVYYLWSLSSNFRRDHCCCPASVSEHHRAWEKAYPTDGESMPGPAHQLLVIKQKHEHKDQSQRTNNHHWINKQNETPGNCQELKQEAGATRMLWTM